MYVNSSIELGSTNNCDCCGRSVDMNMCCSCGSGNSFVDQFGRKSAGCECCGDCGCWSDCGSSGDYGSFSECGRCGPYWTMSGPYRLKASSCCCAGSHGCCH